MEAFDLADRFQTPVFVLSDLDLGMNSWMTPPLPYPEKPFDRGKVLACRRFEQTASRGDAIVTSITTVFRIARLPGTEHPDAGFFTRGTGHDEEARYSELPDVWERNLDRLRAQTRHGAHRRPRTRRRRVAAPRSPSGVRHDAPRGRRSARSSARGRHPDRLSSRSRAAALVGRCELHRNATNAST